MIRRAINHLQKYTCVKFKQRTDEKDFVEIFSGNSGCYSALGRSGGGQPLSLKKGSCFILGTVVHELIHALGYDHMHNHADRDQFVDIKWANIGAHWVPNFEKVNPKIFSNFGEFESKNLK